MREVTRFDHRFAGVERKSLSLDQYCCYPSNLLNRLNLWPRASRQFRFCGHAQWILGLVLAGEIANKVRIRSAARLRRVGDLARAAGLAGGLERRQAFARRGNRAVNIGVGVRGGNEQSFVLRRRQENFALEHFLEKLPELFRVGFFGVVVVAYWLLA